MALHPLPVEELCNRIEPPNPIIGKGELGNEFDNKMDYCGDKTRKHELVRTLQLFLVELGYDIGKSGPSKNGVDGIFGEETEAAVRDFQQKYKDWDEKQLAMDGLVGPRTADALNRALKNKFFPGYMTPDRVKE